MKREEELTVSVKIIAYASSTRPNHLWSAAQFNNALPKNRFDADIPLVAKSDYDKLASLLTTQNQEMSMDDFKAGMDELATDAIVYGLTKPEAEPLNLNITKEWFEKQATMEGDLEIGAGRPEYLPGFVPSAADRHYNGIIARLQARIAAMEEAAKLIEEGFDRPGIAKKQDTCAHGKFGWEDCEQCAVIAIRALKAEGESR